MAGHLHPILGIAARLATEPSVRVRVISTPAAQPSIAASGLEGVALLGERAAEVDAAVAAPGRIGPHPWALARRLRATAALQLRFADELRVLWAHERPDLVLADFTMATLGPLADAFGIPWWTTHPSPCAIEGDAGPPGFVGGWRPGRTALTRARDAAARRAVRGVKRATPRLAGVRLADAGLDRIHRPDGSEAIYSAERIFALTPPEIEYERALPASVRWVGPVLFTPPSGAPPPVLAPRRRHVLVTAGTHLAWHRPALLRATESAAAALRTAGVALHLSQGSGQGGRSHGGRTGFTVHDHVDYQRDLHRFDAVVHHGGSGALGHTLAAGLPAVVWPVDHDQFDHAARLEDAGAAVRLHDPRQLAAAIIAALEDPTYAVAARRISASIARRPAVDAIADEVLRRLS